MGWFEEEFEGLKNKMKWGLKDLVSEDGDMIKPLANVKETPNEFIVKVKLPDVSRKDVHVKLTSDALEVRAERLKQSVVKRKGLSSVERKFIRYYREFPLSTLINHKKAKIDFLKGVLRVRVPKVKSKLFRKKFNQKILR